MLIPKRNRPMIQRVMVKKINAICPRVATRWFILLFCMLGTACFSRPANVANEESVGLLSLPSIGQTVAQGERLRIVATTSIIGDVVRQVGGEAIDLVVLMQPGQDPHSFQPGAADLTAVADADIIFINGWNLEEGLMNDLVTIAGDSLLVPVSAGIIPRSLNEDGHDTRGHSHGPIDPHTWQAVANVIQWADNIQQVLSAADPANSALYDTRAADYRQSLRQLDADLRAAFSTIPEDRRVLVTNHDNLGYFTEAYGFKVAGTIIPSISSLAEPSAGELAALVKALRSGGFCTLILESTATDQLARMLETELSDCPEIHLLKLYTDALGPVGSGAESYEGMMRNNAVILVEELSR